MRTIAPDGSEYLSSKIYESKITILDSQLRSAIGEASGVGGTGIGGGLGIEGSILAGYASTLIVISDYTAETYTTPVCSITGRGVNGGQRAFYIEDKTSSDITVAIDSVYAEDLYFDLIITEKA